MINIAISYPSEVEGCVLDVKKGRSTISFSHDDLRFILGIFDTILDNESPVFVAPPPINKEWPASLVALADDASCLNR